MSYLLKAPKADGRRRTVWTWSLTTAGLLLATGAGLAVVSNRYRPPDHPPTGMQPTGPSLVVADPNVHLGVVEPQETSEVRIEVRNDGDAPLTLTNFRTTCGCTSVTNGESVVLAPFTRGAVHLKVSARETPGSVAHAVFFESDDPEHPKAELKVFAEVQPRVASAPPQVHFGAVAPGREVARTVRVESPRGEAFRILRIDHSGGVSVDSDATRLESAHALRIRWTPDGGDGQVRVFTSLADAPPLSIPLHARLSESVRTFPARLHLTCDGAGRATASVVVSHPGDRSVRADATRWLTVVEGAPAVAATVAKTYGRDKDHATTRLELRFDSAGPMPAGTFEGVLAVALGGAATSTVDIPITIDTAATGE